MSEGANPHVQVPLDVLQKLHGVAAEMGINLPGVTQFAAEIWSGKPVRQLALEIGRLVSRQNIFLKAGALVTVDPKTGEEKLMTAARFIGWVEEFAVVKGKDSPSLTRELATVVLAQDIFRDCIRPLNAVHTMVLPVRREEGLFKVEFLEAGYDEKSGIFTAPVLEYDMTWSIERAREFFREHCEEWPWTWPDEVVGEVEKNRNYLVHVAACLGSYCRAMFPPGTPRPMITYIANQPGTGKSTLVAMDLIFIYGSAATSKTPKDDDKMAAELETVAQSLKPYLFFDDIGAGLFSSPLNRFITSESHTGRIYGQNREVFEVQNVTQVFATGNEIKTSRDLVRRSLVVELFLPGEVRGRKFKKVINLKYLKQQEVRAGFLSACCAIVKHWMNEDNGMMQHSQPLESFEDWTGTIGGMMACAYDFADILIPPDLAAGGAEEDDEMRELLVAVATLAAGDEVFDRKALVAKARELSLLENMLGPGTDGETDTNTSKKFGRQLQHWRGRELRDKSPVPRLFRFGHRRQKRGATYPLTFLKPVASQPG